MSKITPILRILTTRTRALGGLNGIQHLQSRNSSYYSSEFIEDLPNHKVKYETTSVPQEWQYVERLLKPDFVPTPTAKPEYPSGWQPQKENLKDMPYFVVRTKNHMVPVYLYTKLRGQGRLTYVRKIKGDIWLLHDELKEFLQKQQEKPLRTQVNEFVGYICVHGDHVNAIKYYLLQKGF